MKFETLCRRTNEPKLSFIERELDRKNIDHRRKGETWHAPILQVDASKFDAAWDILTPIDDDDDDDVKFY